MQKKVISTVTSIYLTSILFYTNAFAAVDDKFSKSSESNPFIIIILSILKDVKNWLLALGGGITLVVVAYLAISKQASTQSEKDRKNTQIRDAAIWGVGITVAVWFVAYVIDKFAAVNI